MTDHTRPPWADLPHGDEISALLDELRTLSPDEVRAMCAAWSVELDAVWAAAWDAARDAALDTARIAAWDAVDRATAREFATGAARDAVRALVAADLVGEHGLTRDHLDTLTGPACVVPRLAAIIDRALPTTCR